MWVWFLAPPVSHTHEGKLMKKKSILTRVACLIGVVALAGAVTACGNTSDNKYWNAEPQEHYRPQ